MGVDDRDRVPAWGACVSEIDDLFTDMDAHLDRLDAMRHEILDYLACRRPDVPLQQRGFGVMDEPPA